MVVETRFKVWRNFLKGEHAIVCGSGPSFQGAVVGGQVAHKETPDFTLSIPTPSIELAKYWTFATNRAAAKFRPDFAVCCEDPNDDETWDVIRGCGATHVFGNVLWGSNTEGSSSPKQPARYHPMALSAGEFSVLVGDTRGQLIVGSMSPWTAAWLALYMGAEQIGVVGVDVTGHSEFDRPERLEEIEDQWDRLVRVAREKGTSILNLSKISKLRAIPLAGDFVRWKARGRIEGGKA